MTKQKSNPLYSYRCECGKLLFRGLLHGSTIQIKCKRCGRLTSFQGAGDAVSSDAQYALMFNKLGEIISASSNIQDLFGYTIGELLLKQHQELLPEQSGELISKHFERLWSLDRKELYFFRTKVTYWHRDGYATAGYMLSKFVPAPEGGMVLFSAFSTNLDSEPALTSEFSSLREYPFFMRVSPEGICLDASTARKRPYVRPRDEIVGHPFTEFMHESKEMKQALLARLHTFKPFDLIGKRYARVDGSSVRMDTFFAPNFDKSGKCTDFSIYVYDHAILANHERQFAFKALA